MDIKMEVVLLKRIQLLEEKVEQLQLQFDKTNSQDDSVKKNYINAKIPRSFLQRNIFYLLLNFDTVLTIVEITDILNTKNDDIVSGKRNKTSHSAVQNACERLLDKKLISTSNRNSTESTGYVCNYQKSK